MKHAAVLSWQLQLQAGQELSQNMEGPNGSVQPENVIVKIKKLILNLIPTVAKLEENEFCIIIEPDTAKLA